MGVMDSIGKNLSQNVLGFTEKALIEVIDMRDRAINEEEAVPVRKNLPGQRAQIGNTTAMADAGWVQEQMDSIAAEGGMKSVAGDFRGVKPKYFRVQFNPNTLRLSGHSGGLVKSSSYKPKTGENKQEGENAEEGQNQEKGDGGLEYKEGKTYIDFSVSLFFDKVDPMDAFMEDKVQLASLTNLGKGIAKGAMSLAGKKSNTVQPEVEGLIAALRDKHTRLITFHWGDFNYTGILRSVNAVYSMFNINGEPIRASVDLNMTCADSEIAQKSVTAWNNIYYNAFKKGSESFVKTSQKVQSLVNI